MKEVNYTGEKSQVEIQIASDGREISENSQKSHGMKEVIDVPAIVLSKKFTGRRYRGRGRHFRRRVVKKSTDSSVHHDQEVDKNGEKPGE